MSSIFHESKTKPKLEFAAHSVPQVLEKRVNLYLVGGSVALNKFSFQSHLPWKSKFLLKFEERGNIAWNCTSVTQSGYWKTGKFSERQSQNFNVIDQINS